MQWRSGKIDVNEDSVTFMAPRTIRGALDTKHHVTEMAVAE